MLLEKIIIENIRSHKFVEFTPSPIGMTAITGANGAGKSTIVDSFAWCLYGIRPNALKNSELIKYDVNPKEERVAVTVFIRIGNKQYKIERKILSTSGNAECLVYSKNLNSSEWIKESGPSISHAESYIRSLIGFDDKGFLSSIFVQQKEVDSIINASPKERSQAIEKLIGITAITEAINLSKEESRALQKASNLIKVVPVEETKQQIEEQKVIVKKLKQTILELTEKINVDKVVFDKTFKEVEQEQKLQEEKNQLENQLVNIKNTIKLLNEQLKQQIELISSTKEVDVLIPIDIIEKEFENAKKNVKEIESNLLKMKNRHDYLTSLFNVDVKNVSELSNELNTLKQEETSKTTNVNNITVSLLTKQEKYKSNIDFIELLKSDDVTKCRLCGQQINNAKEELEKHLSEQLSLEKEIKELQQLKKTVEKELKVIVANNKEKERVLRSLEDKKEEQNLTKKEFTKLKKDLKQITYELEVERENLKIIQDKYIHSVSATKNRKLIETAKKQIVKTELEIKKANSNLLLVENEILNSKAIARSEFKKLMSDLKEQENQLTKNQIELTKQKGDYNTNIVKGKMLVEDLKNQLKAHEEHAKLMKQLSVINLSTQTLTQFKAERIKYSIPTLTNLASEILEKFTEGTFTKLILTEKFETYVVRGSQNIEVPVKHLSGGELSAVAIALRLAIALFLNNGEQNLLILDEILVSMNSDRSHLILETISSFSKAQIIIIAHNDSINSFADKVFSL